MRDLFGDIAGVYDRMNRILSLGRDVRWRQRAVALIRGEPAEILDLACGTGDFAFALAARFPKAEITGVDLTPEMLERARTKNASCRIGFLEGDAAALPVPPEKRFDLCACAFGFRNFPDRAKALAEVRRVLAPGGELLVLEFFRPRFRVTGLFTALWLKAMTRLFARDKAAAYAWLRTSMATTVTAKEFVALASDAGFVLREHRFFRPCCTCMRFAAS